MINVVYKRTIICDICGIEAEDNTNKSNAIQSASENKPSKAPSTKEAVSVQQGEYK